MGAEREHCVLAQTLIPQLSLHLAPQLHPPPQRLGQPAQEFKRLAKDMVDGAPLNTEDQPRPPNLLSKQWSLVPPVVTDSVPWGMQEGAERWSL